MTREEREDRNEARILAVFDVAEKAFVRTLRLRSKLTDKAVRDALLRLEHRRIVRRCTNGAWIRITDAERQARKAWQELLKSEHREVAELRKRHPELEPVGLGAGRVGVSIAALKKLL